MDWCWYLAVKVLGMTEDEFLKSTPKKLFKLAEIHQEVNTPADEKKQKESEEVYIDSIRF